MLMVLTVILTGATAIAWLTIGPNGLLAKNTVGGGPPGTAVNPSTGCVGTYAAPGGYTCTQLKVAFVNSDPWGGGGVASVTDVAYNPVTFAKAESPATTDSTGTTTSSQTWISGTQWVCKESATNYVTAWIPCTVPANPTGGSNALTTITLPLPIIKLQTYAVTAQITGQGSSGSNWGATFSTFSFANTGASSIVANWLISAVNNNQGFLSSFDPIDKLNAVAVLELKSASSAKTLASNCMYTTAYNNINYCQYVLPDGVTTIGNTGYQASAVTAYFPTDLAGRYQNVAPIVKTTSNGNVQCSGSLSQSYQGTTAYPLNNAGQVTCSTTFQPGSLSGASETWTLTLYLYADIWWYDGVGGPAQNSYGASGTNGAAAQTLSPNWNTVTLKN